MFRYVCLVALLTVVNSQWWSSGYRFGGNVGFAPSVGYANPSVGFASAPAVNAGGNRGYTLTSTIEGAGDALMLRRAYGPRTGFQPNEYQDMKGCGPGYCKNGGQCPFPGAASNGDVGGCVCRYGFTGKQCEVSQGTVGIAMSGARAPHNLFGCNDIDPSLTNDCYVKKDKVVLDDIWHYPHKKYNNLYVQCDQSYRCTTKFCQPNHEFNPMTLTCMPCDREGAPGCAAVQNAVRAVSTNPGSAAVLTPVGNTNNLVQAAPVAGAVGAALPARTYNFGAAFPFNVAYNG